jgi:hypothetical protein
MQKLDCTSRVSGREYGSEALKGWLSRRKSVQGINGVLGLSAPGCGLAVISNRAAAGEIWPNYHAYGQSGISEMYQSLESGHKVRPVVQHVLAVDIALESTAPVRLLGGCSRHGYGIVRP